MYAALLVDIMMFFFRLLFHCSIYGEVDESSGRIFVFWRRYDE